MDCQPKHGGHMPGHLDWPGSFLLPAPMAVFGALVAFMLGMMLGMLIDRKRVAHGGPMAPGRPMMAGGPPWMRMRPPWAGAKPGMGVSHHHHGFGMPECCESHGEWPQPSAGATEVAQAPKTD